MQVLWVTNSPLTIRLDSWRPEFSSKDGIFRCCYCAGILSGEEEDNVIDDQYLQDISDALSEANTERLMELHLHGFISLSTLALNMTTFCTNITKLTFERIGNMDEVLPKLDVLLPELSQLSALYVGKHWDWRFLTKVENIHASSHANEFTSRYDESLTKVDVGRVLLDSHVAEFEIASEHFCS